jgi:uncharacterized membrane protein YedE/YeeE
MVDASGTPAISAGKDGLSIPRSAWFAALAATVAALITWGITDATHPWFRLSGQLGSALEPPPELVQQYLAEKRRVDLMNGTVIFSIGGALLGAALGATPMQPVRLIAGVVGGAVWGAGVGYLGVVVVAAMLSGKRMASLTDTASAQAVVFGLLGVGIGAIHGLTKTSATECARAAVGGLIGGAGGAFLAEIVSGTVFPTQSTLELLPRAGGARAVWLVVPFALIGLIVAAIRDRSRSTRS